MDKQQGPTVEHRELYSISCNKPYWKRQKTELNFHFTTKLVKQNF